MLTDIEMNSSKALKKDQPLQQSQKMQKVLNQARMVIANETKKLNREQSRGSIKKS
jgi:hypothetical protein